LKPLAFPDAAQIDLTGRGVCGKDLQFLRQWLQLTVADCCYVLGLTTPRWFEYQNRPNELVDDASVSLLVWALLNYPEAHAVPEFPAAAEAHAGYRRLVAHGVRPPADPDTAFGLLVGQRRASVARWLTGMGQDRIPPAVRRLFLVLQTLFATRGVQGLEAWIARARFEAASRGFDFDAPEMNWARYPLTDPERAGQSRVGRPPKGAVRTPRGPKTQRLGRPPGPRGRRPPPA